MRNSKSIFCFANVALLFVLFSSCSSRRILGIVGFARKDETINVQAGSELIFNFRVNGRDDNNGFSSLNEKIELKRYPEDVKLGITLDSGGIRLLDTLVTIPKKFKEPFISFLYPTQKTGFKSAIFIADESTFVKY